MTGQITGNGTYSIGVTTTSSDGAAFDSRETGSLAPAARDRHRHAATAGRPGAGRRGRHRELGSRRHAHGRAARRHPGHRLHRGRQRLPERHAWRSSTPTTSRPGAGTRPAPGPSPGNHEYNTAGATGYYSYFGALAGPSGRGYYSYDLGNWHVVSLNSEVNMSAGSAQETWLRGDLAASTKPCTLAYWHKPLFTSGANHAPETRPGRCSRRSTTTTPKSWSPATTTSTSGSRR